MVKKIIKIENARNIAISRNGQCLSYKYINAHSKLKWKCKENHIWMASYNNVKRGTWCPKCGSKKAGDKYRLGIGSARATARKMGGECLSVDYVNTKTKMKWKCSSGHTWWAKYENIKYGKWCPRCKNKTQNKLFNICKDIFPNYKVHYNYRGFDFLYNSDTGKKQEIDIFIHNKDYSFSLAIEYDGRQHFEPVRFGGISIKKAKECLEKTRIMDLGKSGKIINIGIKDGLIKHFVRFNYKDEITKSLVVQRFMSYEIL